MSKVKRVWKEIFNSESNDGTWEIIHFDEPDQERDLRLLFFNYANQGTESEYLKEKIELNLTEEQFESLLKFCKKLNKKIK
jgi:hypothetical protein